MIARRLWLPQCLLVAAQLLAPAGAVAQRVHYDSFVSLGGESDERWRLGQLRPGGPSDGILLRSVSRRADQRGDTNHRVVILLPELRFIRNSALPFSLNEGALRPGRGVNMALAGGAEMRWKSLRLTLAPEVDAEENRPFQVIPYAFGQTPVRSQWANPFHPPPESLDLPLRFGDRSNTRLGPGQSTLTYQLGAVEVGASTENLWWGPGIRDAILLSNNAPGFPHLLARPAHPLQLGSGQIDFDVVLGRLSESAFFDADSSNDHPLLSGAAVTWRADTSAGLQVGLARLRISAATGHDQMTSVFGRWLFPEAGFEMYTEWARFKDPASLRDFLEFPSHEQGYTLGLQWARQLARHRTFRLQSEVSYLEPSASYRLRPVTSSYTSETVLQGFTNGGKILGATTGPGSSAQWFGGDILGDQWRAGVFFGRIRYDNGTLLLPVVPQARLPDVTLLEGIRVARDFARCRIALQVNEGMRLDYLFQGGYVPTDQTDPTGFRPIDISNRTLSVTVTSLKTR